MKKATLAFYTFSLTCFPILFTQGKLVRKHTLRLPPPSGKRIGNTVSNSLTHDNAKTPLNLLLLGDSAAEGVGTDTQKTALLGQLLYQFSDKYQVNYQLIANTGDTTLDAINHLQKQLDEGKNSAHLHDVDLVVISVGVNDVTTLVSLATWKTQLKTLISLLKTSCNAKNILFTAVPPMQVFPALPFPLNKWLGARVNMLNHTLEPLCKEHDCEFLALELSFNSENIAIDGFHPSALTYKEWAEQVYVRYKLMKLPKS